MRRFVSGLLIVISAVSLVLASTSLWTRRNVINTSVFVSNVETMVDLPQVEARDQRPGDHHRHDQPRRAGRHRPGGRRAAATAAGVPAHRRGRHPVDHLGRRGATAQQRPFRPLTEAAVLTSAHTPAGQRPAGRVHAGAGEEPRARLGAGRPGRPGARPDPERRRRDDPDPVGLAAGLQRDRPAEVDLAVDGARRPRRRWPARSGCPATAAARCAPGRSPRWCSGLLVLVTLRIVRGRVVVAAKPDNRDAVGAVYDVLAGSLRVVDASGWSCSRSCVSCAP